MVSTGSSRTRFPHTDKPNPSSLSTTTESLRLLLEKNSVQKTLTSRYDLRLGVSDRNWSRAPACRLASQDRARIVFDCRCTRLRSPPAQKAGGRDARGAIDLSRLLGSELRWHARIDSCC